MKTLFFFPCCVMVLYILFGFTPGQNKYKKLPGSFALVNGLPIYGTGYAKIESKIDMLAKDVVASEKVPGMTVAVSKNGRLVFNKSYGYSDFPAKKPMMPYHRSRIGSVSKIITTLGVMKLAEEKPSFSVNSKVYGPNGVFKDWKDYDTKNAVGKPAWYDKIQVKHLLSHTAGFNGSGDTDGAAEEFDTDPEDLTYKQIHQHFLKTQGLFAEPGTDAKYSNHGLGFSGHILSEVSGLPYHQYIIKKILTPLGLDGKIVPYYKPSIDDYMSSTHKLDGNGNISKMANSNKTEVPRGLAAGGWAASARDMVRLMVATDKLSNYPDILKPATIDLMETKPFPTVSGSHALGWGMQPKGAGKKLAHNGKVGGGTAQIVKFTSGYTATDGTDLSNINIAICTNGNVSTSALNELAGEIAKVTGKETIPADYDLFLTNSYDIIWPENEKVTGVFLEKPNPSVLRVCESWPDFTETWSGFGKKGLQLIDMETINMNGKVGYSGVWEKDPGKQALYRYDSWDKFTKKWDELSKTGYRLIDVARFEAGGQDWYAGVWKEGKGNYALYQFNSWDKFTEKWKELGDKNFRLINIEAYDAGSTTNYIGVWEAGSDKYGLYNFDAWEKFTDKKKELSASGYRLIDFERVNSNGKTLYIGVWRAGKDGHYFWHNVSWNSLLEKQEEQAKSGIYLIDFEVY